MTNKKRRFVGYFLVLNIALAILICPLINAFAMSSDYSRDNPLKMAPGETRDIVFGRLQNTVGDKDIKLRAELAEGKEIALLTDDNLDYLVPKNTMGHEVKMRVSIPEKDFKNEYNIAVRFSDIGDLGNEGTVSMAAATKVSIKVLVEIPKRESAFKNSWWIFLLIAVVIAIILYFFFKNKKFSKPFDKSKK